MASIKENLVTKLIGFEEGINIKNLDQLTNTIRARFVPLSKPKIAFTENSKRKYSAVIKIKSIPEDPGDGNFTLKIESPIDGQDLVIRAVGENKSKSTLTIDPSVAGFSDLEGLSFSITNQRKFLKVNAEAVLSFKDNSAGDITLRSAENAQLFQVIQSGNAAARASDFATKVNTQLNNAVYGLITAEARSNLVFLTQTTPGDSGNTVISKASISNLTVPDSFSNGDGRNSKVNFTFSSGFSYPNRISMKNWIVGTSGALNTESIIGAIESTLKKASEEGELEYNITRTIDNTGLVIESKFNGADRNHTPTGTAISSGKIILPIFTGGSLGSLASENTGKNTHPRDNTAYSLGLKTPPSYYARGGDGTRYREVLDSDSQKIKRMTFDINNIINYHKSRTAISSKIIGDDTLLITHENYAGYSNAMSAGKKVQQNGISDASTIFFSSSNWKLTSSVNDSNHFRDDISFEKIFEKENRKIVIPLSNPANLLDEDMSEVNDKEYMTMSFQVLSSFENPLPKYRISIKLSDSRANSSAVGADTVLPFSLSVEKDIQDDVTLEVRKIITIYPYHDIPINLTQNNTISARDNFFTALSQAFRYCYVPLNIRVDQVEQELIIEEDLELTQFSLNLANPEVIDLNGNTSQYLSVNRANTEDFKRYGFTVATASGYLRMIFNDSIYGPRGPQREIDDQYGRAIVYEVGTRDLEEIQDHFRILPANTNISLKNRILRALQTAQRKGDFNPTIKMEVSTPNIEFFYTENSSDLGNFSNDLYNQQFFISLATDAQGQQLQISFFFSDGNFNGQMGRVARTGRILEVGDIIRSSLTGPTRITEGHRAIGSFNIRLENHFGITEVLREMKSAIESAFTHHEIDAICSNVSSDLGQLNAQTGAMQSSSRRNFFIYYHPIFASHLDMREINLIRVHHPDPNVLPKFPSTTANIPNFSLPRRTIKFSYNAEEALGVNHESLFMLQQTRTFQMLAAREDFTFKHRYGLDDFLEAQNVNTVRVNFRDGEKPYYFLSPNHDVEIKSFGFGDQRSQLAHYEDLTVHGRVFDNGFQNFKHTTHLDPVFYLESSSEIRFPIRLKNIGSQLGYELDGVIEPLDLREILLGRTISESATRKMKGALLGSYSYCPRRNSSTLISNKLNYENFKNIPYLDNELTKGFYMESSVNQVLNISDSEEKNEFISNFYFTYQGIIFNNDEKLFPFLDVEEKQYQNSILSGNNPEDIHLDPIVGKLNSMTISGGKSLGGENFSRTSGFQFSSNPHPGSDTFVFGGLRYV